MTLMLYNKMFPVIIWGKMVALGAETMPTVTPTPFLVKANPYIISFRQLGKWFFIFLAAGILISLVIKIILDLRRLHYRN